MTRHELVALMPGAGPPATPPGCLLVAGGGHVAVLARARLLPLARRAEAVKAAAERAAVLEALLPHGTVLPALPGQRVEADEVADLVAANLPLLRDLAHRLADRVQYQVTVRWTADRAAAAFGVEPEGLPAVAAALGTRLADRLAATGAEITALPVAGDVLSNAALLIPRQTEPALDAALEEIDRIWSAGLAIRVVGPLPAVSFASLVFDRASPAAARDARAAFGLPAGFSAEALKAARRTALMSASPDRREQVARQAELLGCLARLGGSEGAVLVGRLWSEGMSAAKGGAARAA
jgi:hypothetical protein